MTENHTLDELRRKAHEINCDLIEKDYEAREIEIIGYYLKRIAASYLSFHTHQELSKAEKEAGELTFKKRYEQWREYI